MGFNEEDAIETINRIIKDFQHYDKIIEAILNLRETLFPDELIKAKFKSLYNLFKILKNNPAKDIEFLKSELNAFLKSYYNYKIMKEKKKAIMILNEAGELLKQRRILTRREELLRLAKRCNYIIGEERKEGTLIMSKDEKIIITVIPKSNNINRGTAISIMETLATGKSSFRK